MIYHKWVNDIKEFDKIAPLWDKVVLESGEDNPFALSDFILAWWKHYSEGRKLRIFVLYDNDKIIGGIPLCMSGNGVVEHIGGIAANYTEPISRIDKSLFWSYFLKALDENKGWRRLALKRMRRDKFKEYYPDESAFDNAGLLTDIFDDGYSYLIKIPESFSGYINKLPKKLRYYLKRSEEGLSSLGEVKLRPDTGKEDAAKLADKFIEFSRKSFKGRNRRSAFENESYCSFFKELVKRFCAKGYLDANALMLDDKIIAIHFGYLLAITSIMYFQLLISI